jgi:hypothetical protein
MVRPLPGATAGSTLLGAIVGLAVGAVALALAAREVDGAALAAAFARAGVWPIVLGALVHTLVQAIYTVRWRVLLGTPLSIPRLFGLVGLGYLANYTLPGRPGELVRGGLARGLLGVPLALALTSLLLEKVLDGLTILLSALVFSALVGLPTWLSASVLVGGAAFALGGAVLVVAALVPNQRPGAPAGRAAAAIQTVRALLAEAGAPLRHAVRAWPAVALLGGLNWLAILAHLALLCAAVGLAPMPGAWLLLYAALGLASVVPGAPGYVGTYQLAAVLTLGGFGVEPEPAFVVATLYQASRLLGALAVGSWAIAREGIGALRRARVTVSDARCSLPER